MSLDTLNIIQDFLHENNQYVHVFKQARDRLNVENLEVKIVCPDGADNRTHNLPRDRTEVAVLIPETAEVRNYRDIVLSRHAGGLKRINELHSGYDPLCYPILNPHGQPGYHLGLTGTNNKKVTLKEYASYHLQARPGMYTY